MALNTCLPVEAVNECPILLCLCTCLLLYLLNCHYLNPWFFLLLPSRFLSLIPLWGTDRVIVWGVGLE